MKRKMTFKEWLANFFEGSWQVLCWIGRIFSPKNKTVFWRVIWAVITCCILFATCVIGWTWYQETYKSPLRYCDTRRISQHIDFVKPRTEGWSGWTQNVQTGEKITEDIDWVAMPADEDSLVVFGSKGKRGYINRYSGEVSIPAKYKKAWIFSEGVAGVMEKDSVYFIDHYGRPVNKKKFGFNPKTDGYVYHGDYCAIAANDGRMGLIDKDGNWAVLPEYDSISSEIFDFWLMSKGHNERKVWYAFNNKAEQITDEGYPSIEISKDYGVTATLPNHMLVSYGFDGKKSGAFIVYDIETLYYETDKYDENGERVYLPATLKRYYMPDGYEGLCTSEGEMVTEPLYCGVRALDKDLYLCKMNGKAAGFILNSKGERVSQM